MSTGSLVFAGIAPHPPIMVPEVGREAIAEVHGSIEAMRELTTRIIESGAETVVLVSPHAPLDARAFVAYEDAQLYGDFANFRAPDARVEAPLDEEMLNAISRAATEQGYEVIGIHGYDLDHGAIAMEMDRDVLAGRQGPRRRREAPQHHQRKSTKRDGAWTTARRHCRRNCEKSHRHGNLSCSNLS